MYAALSLILLYSSSIQAGIPPEKFQYIVGSFVKHADMALKQPYQFSPYHKSIREPFDYYAWGNDFMRTLIIEEQSQLIGVEQFQEIDTLTKQGDNIWILSNHQTEADPQVISILLEKHGLSHLAEKMIFIAGHKVTNDPVAIPFSMVIFKHHLLFFFCMFLKNIIYYYY